MSYAALFVGHHEKPDQGAALLVHRSQMDVTGFHGVLPLAAVHVVVFTLPQTSRELDTMNPTLALDLGMTTGYAHCIDGKRESGVIKLKGTKKTPLSYGASLDLLRTSIRDMMFSRDNFMGPLTICYEDVRRHMGTRAAHVYGALEGVLHILALYHPPQITLRTYSVQQIKQHATGRCVAGKDEMLAAAQMRWTWCKTHDEADALWLLDLELTSHNQITDTKGTT